MDIKAKLEEARKNINQALIGLGEQKKEEKPKETELEKAAKKAARTGNRTDLQQYLKLRRNYL